ncbi:hypothetical protein EVAR_11566_1 [Eumeta japonica]|uniref:Uncharacterized protein n=1 Tax=Eumeta variegata TaxID=151549 RepID=A0A4C1X3I7_EUMVA|nr:hypothetical protein EVAR_11566_1 [Eumeta japonica]
MQLTCATDAPPIKCGSGASDTVLANRHLVLGLIKSERKKTLSIIDHAATLQEIRRPYRKKHREERQSGWAYAAIAEIAVTAGPSFAGLS